MFRRLFFCTLGFHHRDGRRAYYAENSTPRAPCKYCGTKLEKGAHGKWHVASKKAADQPSG